jgi:tight adherence protein B
MQQYAISFIFVILAVAGLFFLFRIPFTAYFNKWAELLRSRKKSKRIKRHEVVTGEKHRATILKYFDEVRDILIKTGKMQMYPLVKVISVLLLPAGIFIGLALGNLFLALVLAVGLFFIPYIFVHSMKGAFIRENNDNLKASLSVITNTYIQSEDILYSVESNLKLLRPPYSDIFDQFVYQAKFIEASLPKVISIIKDKVDNLVFKEWCDVLIQCCDNKELKFVLSLTVEKLDEIIAVQTELDTLSEPETKHFQTIFLINLLSLPLLYLIQRSWYEALANNPPGQLLIAAYAAVSFIALNYSVKVLKPVEYQ